MRKLGTLPMSAYREPAQRPGPRIERLRLRRYPFAIQFYLLIWLPLLALGVSELIPWREVTCTRPNGEVRCLLETHALIRGSQHPIAAKIERMGAGETDTARLEFMMASRNDAIYFNCTSKEADAWQKAMEDFLASDAPSLRLTLRSLAWFLALCGALEAAILLYFLVAQRKIVIDFDLGAGTLCVGGQTVQLSEIKDVEMTDLDEKAMSQAVEIVTTSGRRERLFHATNAEARRGYVMIEGVRERWSQP